MHLGSELESRHAFGMETRVCETSTTTLSASTASDLKREWGLLVGGKGRS